MPRMHVSGEDWEGFAADLTETLKKLGQDRARLHITVIPHGWSDDDARRLMGIVERLIDDGNINLADIERACIESSSISRRNRRAT